MVALTEAMRAHGASSEVQRLGCMALGVLCGGVDATEAAEREARTCGTGAVSAVARCIKGQWREHVLLEAHAALAAIVCGSLKLQMEAAGAFAGFDEWWTSGPPRSLVGLAHEKRNDVAPS